MLVFFILLVQFCVKMSQLWLSDKIMSPIMLEVVFDRYSSNNNTFRNSIFNPILYNTFLNVSVLSV